jgi:hypothetical protein
LMLLPAPERSSSCSKRNLQLVWPCTKSLHRDTNASLNLHKQTHMHATCTLSLMQTPQPIRTLAQTTTVH